MPNLSVGHTFDMLGGVAPRRPNNNRHWSPNNKFLRRSPSIRRRLRRRFARRREWRASHRSKLAQRHRQVRRAWHRRCIWRAHNKALHVQSVYARRHFHTPRWRAKLEPYLARRRSSRPPEPFIRATCKRAHRQSGFCRRGRTRSSLGKISQI